MGGRAGGAQLEGGGKGHALTSIIPCVPLSPSLRPPLPLPALRRRALTPSPPPRTQATSVELSVGIIKACKPERQLFCKDVQAGQARVFRCLAENMNDADFGNNCKYQIMNKLQRR